MNFIPNNNIIDDMSKNNIEERNIPLPMPASRSLSSHHICAGFELIKSFCKISGISPNNVVVICGAHYGFSFDDSENDLQFFYGTFDDPYSTNVVHFKGEKNPGIIAAVITGKYVIGLPKDRFDTTIINPIYKVNDDHITIGKFYQKKSYVPDVVTPVNIFYKRYLLAANIGHFSGRNFVRNPDLENMERNRRQLIEYCLDHSSDLQRAQILLQHGGYATYPEILNMCTMKELVTYFDT